MTLVLIEVYPAKCTPHSLGLTDSCSIKNSPPHKSAGRRSNRTSYSLFLCTPTGGKLNEWLHQMAASNSFAKNALAQRVWYRGGLLFVPSGEAKKSAAPIIDAALLLHGERKATV